MTHHDLGFLIVQRDQIGHGKYIGLAVGLQCVDQHAHAHFAGEETEVQTVPGCQRHAAWGQSCSRLVSQIVAAGGERSTRCTCTLRPAAQGAPLHAEFSQFIGINLDDECFDINLRTPCIELVDDGTQIAIHRFAGGDDEGIG